MENYENRGFLKRNAVLLVVLLAFTVFGYVLYNGWDKVLNDGIDELSVITGNFSCLPLKEGIVPTEEACFLGLLSRDGDYYALDVSRIQDANTDLGPDDTIAVTGFIRPKSEIATSSWGEHEIKAIIQVNTLLRTR